MEVGDGGNTSWATIATCHFTRLSIFSLHSFIFCNLWIDGRRGSDGGRQVKIWTADTLRRITWIWTTRLLMGIHIHLPLRKLSCGDADADLLLIRSPYVRPNQNCTPPICGPCAFTAAIGFQLLCHWVYGASLGLLMAQSRATYMNMEISCTLHMLF